MRIKTPITLKDARERLATLDQLVLAKEWERAAIVATFVRLDTPPGPKDMKDVSYLTPLTFAEMGVVGLASAPTVRKYVRAWLDNNDGQYPAYGKTVTLPTVPFPSLRGTDGYNSPDGLRSTIERAIEHHGAEGVQSVVSDVVGHPPHPSRPLPPVEASPMGASPVSEFREHIASATESLQIIAGAVGMMGGLDGMRADDAARLANLCDVWDSTIAPLMHVEVST